MEDKPKRFLSVMDVSTLLGRRPPTVKEYISKHGLPAYKISNRLLIDRDDLEHWLQERRTVVGVQ